MGKNLYLMFMLSFLCMLVGCQPAKEMKMRVEKDAEGIKIISSRSGFTEGAVRISNDPNAICLMNEEGTLLMCREGEDVIIQVETQPTADGIHFQSTYSKFMKDKCTAGKEEISLC